jgi:anti-sigma factor RsiW
MSDVWTERLSEYVDGELGAADRVALEAHLPGCRECATGVAELRAVVSRARSLENPPPAADLWPGIAARLGTNEGRTDEPQTVIRLRPRLEIRFSVPQLMAASVALMLLSGGAVWLVLQRSMPSGRGPLAGAPPAVSPYASSGDDAAPAVVRASLVDNPRYDVTVAELERVLAEGRGQLDSSTVRVLEQNLAIINRAVEQARRAVAADPANPYLRSHLTATMRRKADFLRRATVLASAG